MYNSQAYNSLPSLFQAASMMDVKTREHLVKDIRQLFLDKNVYNKYGISLLHKHFEIAENQRLVDLHHTSTAWTVGDTDEDIVRKYGGYVVPRTFRSMDGELVPYEFGYSDSEKSYDLSFHKELGRLLVKLGLDSIFGLRYLGDDDLNSNLTLEITEDRANIMMPRGILPKSEEIEALWVFSPEPFVFACHCRSYCVVGNKSHTGESGHGCS
jgi:hypothetical protein